MAPEVMEFLQSLGGQLHLEPRKKADILQELQAHLQEKAQEWVERGYPASEAVALAARELGPPQELARQMYLVHGASSWREVIMGALPHLVVALLFAFNLWRSPSWLAITLVPFLLLGIYGWWQGQPRWAFSWLGYALLPLLLLFILSLFFLLQGIWAWLSGSRPAVSPWLWFGLAAYIPLALWVLGAIAVRVVRHDWIYVSLMALPTPALAAWLLALRSEAAWLEADERAGPEAGVALVFLGLAVTTAFFLRLRWRLLKASLVVVVPALLVGIAWASLASGMGVMGSLLAMFLVAGFLVSPALLGARLERPGLPGHSTGRAIPR